MKARLLIESGNQLGEGPVWDFRSNELLWVDIEKKQVWALSEKGAAHPVMQFEEPVGVIVPTIEPDLYLLGLKSSIGLWNRKTKHIQRILSPEAHLLNNRFNDGKCDPAGRFWLGSMSLLGEAGAGSLYCLDSGFSVQQALDHITISNGLDWSVDKKTMYYIDTATHSVFAFDFDIKTAQVSNQRVIIQIPESCGLPDGMCVDSDGMLWIALWGGGAISQWDPISGTLIKQIDVPALNVSSLCFGGPHLSTLFITSARVGLSESELKQYPLSGSVFTCEPGVFGRRINLFEM